MKYSLYGFLTFVFLLRFLTTQPHFVNGQFLKITGRVYQEPSISGKNIRFNLAGIKVIMPSADLHYGDYIVIEGEYQNGEVINAKLDAIKISDNFFVHLRRLLIAFYQKSLPQPHASLIQGIVIGAKSNLPYDFSTNLKNTGTSHVVVASGMNVTMTASFVLALLLTFLKRQKAVIVTLITIWCYTLITGFEAPIIRASIMATFTYFALLLGKPNNSLRYAIITGLIMLIIVPNWITDIGFLLSFTTTLSLILFESKVSRLLHFVPSILRQDLSTSMAAQIGSAPLIFFVFGRLNLLSPIINALILWTIAPIMIIAGVSGGIGLFFPGLGKILLLLTYPLTSWFILVVNLFS